MQSDPAIFSQKMIRAAQEGDPQAMDGLLRMHQGMIHLLAGRLRCQSSSMDELIQAGNLGLVRALERYDCSLNTKLITYAVPWILGEMRRMLKQIEKSTYSFDRPMDEAGQTLLDVLAGEEGINIQHIDLRMALEKLSSEERMLICLRYYRDKTQRESAELLGKSQAQISRLERQALDTLRALLS